LYVNVAKGEQCDVGGQQTSGCDTNCTYAVCGDGTTNSSAGEQCDDNNTTPGDGCSATCTLEPPVGDTCANAIALSLGANTVNWIALGKEYLPTTPTCTSGYSTTGPDVVLSYQATFTGTLVFTINKPFSTRWVVLADDGSCGSVSSPLACVSDYSASSMTGSIPVVSGSSYWFYVADTTNGSNPLSKPFTITLVDAGPPGPGEDCSNPIVLNSGSNSVSWTASLNNYMPSTPSCSGSPISGPDVVLAYTPSFSTTVTYTISKPTSTRWVAMASSVCGSLSSPLTCTSDYSFSSMSGSFSAIGGSTYYLHVADTTSGANPLSNPFTITISP
jgi:cysteine-rich repeat protein